MNKVKDLFPSEFVLKIENEIGNAHYIDDVTLKLFPADHQGQAISLSDYPSTSAKYSKKSNLTQTPEKPITSTRGKINIGGYFHNIGDGYYKQVYEKSVGGLICLPVYFMEGDDMLGLYLPEYIGHVILDKELNVVYQNTYTKSRIFYRPEDANKFLFEFGPCALAFVDTKTFNSDMKKDFERVFEKRIKSLEEKFVSDEKIIEEKETFKQAIDILEKSNQKEDLNDLLQ